MNQPPESIFLQWHGDGDPKDGSPVIESEVTWCRERVFAGDVEYVRSETTSDAQTWKELYNLASFDWDTMPEAGKRRFRELVLEAAEEALDRRRNKQPPNPPAPSQPA